MSNMIKMVDIYNERGMRFESNPVRSHRGTRGREGCGEDFALVFNRCDLSRQMKQMLERIRE